MIDEIYDYYEKRLSTSNSILKMRGIDEEINKLPLGINLDIANILSTIDIYDYDEKKAAKKIKEAYVEVFKEGIYLGIGFGKILKFNYAKSHPENYVECLEEDYQHFTFYDFKIEVLKKIIPPIKVKKFTQERHPKEINYRNESFEDIRSYTCINVETQWEDKFDFEVNPDAKEMEDYIRQREVKSYEDNEELKKCVDDLKMGIQNILFQKFFEALEVDLEKAENGCENNLRFDEETAKDVFISPVFSNLEGEFKIRELINRYLIYVFNEGKIIGLLNGIKIVLEDIQNDRLDYEEMNSMSSRESFLYIKEGL